jgi:cytochrome oxidase assembly protein ShyY1
VAGILFPPDAISGPQADATPVDRVTEVDLGRIGAALPYPILPVYVLLQHQEPAQTGGLPEPPPLPPLTNGPHLSYAAQWFGFAAIALIGFVVLLRRDRTEAAAAASLPRTSGEEDA